MPTSDDLGVIENRPLSRCNRVGLDWSESNWTLLGTLHLARLLKLALTPTMVKCYQFDLLWNQRFVMCTVRLYK